MTLNDLELAGQMSEPFSTLSRELLDAWGAAMGAITPLEVRCTLLCPSSAVCALGHTAAASWFHRLLLLQSPHTL